MASTCTCPPFNPDEYDGFLDHAAACADCPDHGTAVYVHPSVRPLPRGRLTVVPPITKEK